MTHPHLPSPKLHEYKASAWVSTVEALLFPHCWKAEYFLCLVSFFYYCLAYPDWELMITQCGGCPRGRGLPAVH